MNGLQYEELCRYFLAQATGLAVETIVSVRIPNPKRADLPQYSHQIDLFWETGDEICLYLNIANAKWRGSAKVDLGEILLLQQVKQEVAAHKAVMITNTEFTSGAQAAAQDKGIALHIVQPTFDTAILSITDRELIQQKLAEIGSPSAESVFEHAVCHRAFDLTETRTVSQPVAQPAVPVKTRVIPSYSTRVVGSPSTRGGSFGGASQGGPGGGSANRGGGGGYRTR